MAGYVFFTEEQKNRANSVDLVDFLSRRGEKLIPSGRDKRMASDKSITVQGSRWYDHSAEKGSHAIDLVMRLDNLSFPEAVSVLLGGEQGVDYKQHTKESKPEPRKPFALPQAHTDMRRVFAYLIKQRFIDRDVLAEFAREKLIYEDKDFHNAVFVGYDEKGTAKHAHKKSTLTIGDGYRGNVEGSIPAYSFHYISKKPNPQTLFAYEAPIDMLSHISLLQKNSRVKGNWQNASFVALNGVSEKPILKLLELYPKLNHVVLCLDHDAAGIEASERIYDSLMEKDFYSVGKSVSINKDWNEDLKAKNGVTPLPAEEHPQIVLRDKLYKEIQQRVNELKDVDCSISLLSELYEKCKIHLHSGRFEKATQCLQDITSLSVLAATKEYKQMEHSRDLNTVESRLYHGFKAHKNRGQFKSKMSDIRQVLVSFSNYNGMQTQSQKTSKAEQFENLAAETFKGLIITQLPPKQEQQAEEKQSAGMVMA